MALQTGRNKFGVGLIDQAAHAEAVATMDVVAVGNDAVVCRPVAKFVGQAGSIFRVFAWRSLLTGAERSAIPVRKLHERRQVVVNKPRDATKGAIESPTAIAVQRIASHPHDSRRRNLRAVGFENKRHGGGLIRHHDRRVAVNGRVVATALCKRGGDNDGCDLRSHENNIAALIHGVNSQ